MEFKKLDDKYLAECVNIAEYQYKEEQKSVPGLYLKDYKKEMYQSLKSLFNNDNGVIAFEKDKLAGYLCFGGIRGEDKDGIKGTFSPLCGYGISKGCNRRKMASLLFQYASETLCEKKVGSYDITVYAHDMDVIASYVLNNFGILCTDAVRMIDSSIFAENTGEYTYEELSKNGIHINEDKLLKLWRQLADHLRKSPTYYPGEEFTDEAYLDYIHDGDTRVFVVKIQENIIGMIDVSKDGNDFVTAESDTMNVSDLYLEPGFRGKYIAQQLLLYVSNTLKKDSAKRLWVEHGTTNPTAQGFWGKYFKEFTYTLTRNLDNKILIK